MFDPKRVAKNPAFWASTIAIAFFVINLAQIGRYGLSFDEPNAMERGRETVALAVGTIWPASGMASGMQNDRNYDWIHLHPSFYATVNYGVSSALTKWFGWQPIPAGHFLNLLTASAGLVVLFYLGTLLFNPVVGLVAEIFMMLFPRFIGNAHFNEKDVPMMVFGTVALLLLNVAARKGQVRYWIFAGLSIGRSRHHKIGRAFCLADFFGPMADHAPVVGQSASGLAEYGMVPRRYGYFRLHALAGTVDGPATFVSVRFQFCRRVAGGTCTLASDISATLIRILVYPGIIM